MNQRVEQELATAHAYSPLLASLPEGEFDSPPLAGGESYEWEAVGNLDSFLARVYRYWHERGFVTMLVSRALNLVALAFTIAFSGFLLLFVNWGALHSACIMADTCDIMEVALYKHPLLHNGVAWNVLFITYLAIFGLYWLWTLVHFVMDCAVMAEMRHFFANKLGVSERQVQVMTWAEVVHRLVLLQRSTRLCVVRDLSEHDMVSRIMRKENYLIGMLNRGVLALHVPLLGRRRLLLTRTMEWNLYWCVLDHMLDDQFHLRPDFADERKLQRRFRSMAAANLLLSPFLLIFLLIIFFMRNAEKFYNHPGSIGSRRWSPLAKWRLREFNELPHYVHHRLNASHAAAVKYLSQFPSPLITHLAKFVAFVTGSFAALLLFLTMVDDKLLERDLLGRHIVWWVATLGVVLAISRGLIQEEPVACDPERALAEVAMHTHHLPRHWRGRAHTREVQEEFAALFEYKAALFVEEVTSIVLTPFVLWFSLPRCAGNVINFVQQYTQRVEGVGDVCSLSLFNFERHGNPKYGAPLYCDKSTRSRQGKMEKSFLSFVTTYPTWEPQPTGKRMLLQLAQHEPSPAAMSRYGGLANGWATSWGQGGHPYCAMPSPGRHGSHWAPGPPGSSTMHGDGGPMHGWGQAERYTASHRGAAGMPSSRHGRYHPPEDPFHCSPGWCSPPGTLPPGLGQWPTGSAAWRQSSSGHMGRSRAGWRGGGSGGDSHVIQLDASGAHGTAREQQRQGKAPGLSVTSAHPLGAGRATDRVARSHASLSHTTQRIEEGEEPLHDPLSPVPSQPLDDALQIARLNADASPSRSSHHPQHDHVAHPHLGNGEEHTPGPQHGLGNAERGVNGIQQDLRCEEPAVDDGSEGPVLAGGLPASSLHWIDSCMLHSALLGASIFGSEPGSGSEALPRNETSELQSRIVLGHSLLQSFYEDHDDMLQARLHAPQALLRAAAARSFSRLSQHLGSS